MAKELITLALADGTSVSVDKEFSPARDLAPAALELARDIGDVRGAFPEGPPTPKDADGKGGGEPRRFVSMQLLETRDPSEDYDGTSLAGTDALQRQLLALGVNTRGDVPAGIAASTLEDLYKAGGGRGAFLVPFVVARAYSVGGRWGTGALNTPLATMTYDQARFYGATNPFSEALRPNEVSAAIQADSLRQSLLPLMVAVEEVTDGTPFQAFVVTRTPANERYQATSEGAPLRVVEITGSARTHYPAEFGTELRASYRVSSQWQLPLFAFHIAALGEQDLIDQEQAVYEVARDGDGSGAAATNTNVSSLVGGVAGTVTYANLLEWLRLFEGNGEYFPTIGIAPSAVMAVLDRSNTGSANFPTFGPLAMAMLAGQGAQPERRTFPPVYGRSYASANRLFAFDGTKSIRLRKSPVLMESDKWISNRIDRTCLSYFWNASLLQDGGRRSLDSAN